MFTFFFICVQHETVFCKGQWPTVSLKEPDDSSPSVVTEQWDDTTVRIEIQPHHDVLFYLAYLISIARLQDL